MQTVLITGVGRGIGKALAQKFLTEDFRVWGTSTSGAVEYDHQSISVFMLDLSSEESIIACVNAIQKLDTSIDILINNAGTLADEDETRVIIEKLRKTLEVNLIGTIDFTERMVPLIKRGGHIVNISSTAGSLAFVDTNVSHYPYHYPAYKISKTALNMYTRTLALALKDQDITVSSLHPGWVKTDMGGDDANLTSEEAAKYIYTFAISKPKTGQFWFKGEKLAW